MFNPKSLENLKLGRSPGRPAGSVSITEALRRYCKQHPEKVDEMVKSWMELAQTIPAFATLVAERVDGKVTQPVSGEGGGPVQIKIFTSSDREKSLVSELG